MFATGQLLKPAWLVLQLQMLEEILGVRNGSVNKYIKNISFERKIIMDSKKKDMIKDNTY